MNHRERSQAALRGDEVDRTPISFWRHFPHQDRTAEGLARAMVDFQRAYDLDFVKLMPTGMYPTQDYGAEIRVADGVGGSTELVSGPIRTASDWYGLGRLDVTRGVLADQVEAVRLVRAELGDEVPLLQTLFSPLTVAHKLAPDRLIAHLADEPRAVEAALGSIAAWSVDFAGACLDAGCDGFFFATQVASAAVLPEARFGEWGVHYDRQLLAGLDGRAWFNLIHAHGADTYWGLLAGYPVQGINWHDRETAPSLVEALALTDRCLIAGIHRVGVIRTGTPEQAAAEVSDAIAQTGGRRLIVAPGCVLAVDTPPENLRAARAAVGA